MDCRNVGLLELNTLSLCFKVEIDEFAAPRGDRGTADPTLDADCETASVTHPSTIGYMWDMLWLVIVLVIYIHTYIRSTRRNSE